MRFRFICFAFFFISIQALAVTATELPSHPNRTEIRAIRSVECDGNFSFAVVGDGHSEGNVQQWLTNALATKQPSFVISNGDFTDNGTPEEYTAFVSRISSTGIPWLAVPGNHEYRSPEGHTSPDGNKKFEAVFGNSDFMFDYCGFRFIGLDVVAYDTLLPAQVNKFEKAAAAAPGRSLVFMHYPPGIIPHWEEGYFRSGADRFMELMEEHEVKYFVSGHIHVYDVYEAGPSTYIVSGGGGGGLDSDRSPENLNSPDSGAFFHFILFTVKDSEMSYEVIRKESVTEEKE